MLCSFTKRLETVNFKWATQSSSTNTPPAKLLIRRRFSIQFRNSPSPQLTCRTVFLIPPQLHTSMAAASISSDGDVLTAGSNYAEIIVIRHGETLWNADGRIQGHLDVDLNEVGRQQAETVAARLSKEPKISAVYSSDLKRAHETAEIIARNCGGLEVIKDRDLRERHLGALQGGVYHEIATINPEAHKAFVSKSLDQEIPGGGESLNQLYLRATSCLQKIGDKHRGQRVVIVTHGGLIRALHRRATTHHRVGKVLWNDCLNIMGICVSRPSHEPQDNSIPFQDNNSSVQTPAKTSPFYTPSPAHFLFSKNSQPVGSPPTGSSKSTPKRLFPFPPPSPAKHIKAAWARRRGLLKPNEAPIPENNEVDGGAGLDKSFGFSKNFGSKFEVGEEVGRGHFGYTCRAKFNKGEFKGQDVAVKVIPKAKMTTAIAIEDVRREVKILRALTGHNNLVQFYDAYEDHTNVYVVMELCEGGELLDRILSRGGKYTEDDAKAVMIQILNVVAFCHLQGVVHRDLKPENFLFKSKDEDSQLKAIDFGLSDYVKPDERLNDIVGSAYYVAPEVLHRSYSTEADVWSIGVISYILLCGSRPFWARTESGIFRAVLKADISFDEPPWPSVSSEAKDFVKRLLNKDPRKRMTAAQALCHSWIKDSNDIKFPLDILVFKLMKVYMRSSPLRKAALRALSKTLTVDELFYLKEQFVLLEPNKNGSISLENIKQALMRNSTDAMKDSRVHDILISLNALQYRRMDFEEFCAAALSVYQLEALDRWEQHARCAYELFEKDGNRAIMIEELASELGLGPSIPVHAVLHDWIRHTDGKLSFLGYVKLLHGVSTRAIAKAR